MELFEEYKNHTYPIVRERANNWAIAIGIQCVDGVIGTGTSDSQDERI